MGSLVVLVKAREKNKEPYPDSVRGMAMRCRTCRSENPGGNKYCIACGKPMDQPASGQPVGPKPAQPSTRSPQSRGQTVIWVIAILLALVIAIGIIGYLPSSKIRLVTYNQAWLDMRVTVSIDGEIRTDFNLAAREESVAGVWTVDTGTHLVEVNYAFPDIPPFDLGNPPEWSDDVKVGLFNTKNVYLVLA